MPALAHIGVGLGSKKVFKGVPLWALLVSSIFLDLLTIVFSSVYWITHGLIMSLVWSGFAFLVTALTVFLIRKKNKQQEVTHKPNQTKRASISRISFAIALVVFSHWVLDFIGWPLTAINSVPIGTPFFFSDDPNFGLGVYTTLYGALIMDLGVFFLGLAVYLRFRKDQKAEKITKE